jgi:hypothetical protein
MCAAMSDRTLQSPGRFEGGDLDKDLAEQARPGHGIASQDPNPVAQIALEPKEAEREARSVMTGGGMVGGVAIGAFIGVVMAARWAWWSVARWVRLPAHWVSPPLAPWSTRAIRAAPSRRSGTVRLHTQATT